MKQLNPLLILSTVTFFLAAGVIVVGMKVAPTMFGGEAAPDSTATAALDSLAPAGVQADSLHLAPPEFPDREQGLLAAQAEIARLKWENDSLRNALAAPPPPVANATYPDSSTVGEPGIDSKGAAKMIESMTPESAAKVLVQLSTDDAKKVIRGVKARQAGKILALLPPERAAHLMR